MSESSVSEASDFISVAELSRRTGFDIKTLYNQYAAHSGPFRGLFTKVGGKLLIARADYDSWLKRQQKFNDAA